MAKWDFEDKWLRKQSQLQFDYTFPRNDSREHKYVTEQPKFHSARTEVTLHY